MFLAQDIMVDPVVAGDGYTYEMSGMQLSFI